MDANPGTLKKIKASESQGAVDQVDMKSTRGDSVWLMLARRILLASDSRVLRLTYPTNGLIENHKPKWVQKRLVGMRLKVTEQVVRRPTCPLRVPP